MIHPGGARTDEPPRRWSWRARVRRPRPQEAAPVAWPLQMAGAVALGTLVAFLVALAVLGVAH